MQHTIRKLYSTDRKGPLTIRTNRTNSNSTLRTARALNDPYESNELNLPLADRYSAGVLDMSAMINRVKRLSEIQKNRTANVPFFHGGLHQHS